VRPFIAGMLLMGYLTAALFFVRFWTRTRDQLFLSFAVAFMILAVQRVILSTYVVYTEPVWVYGLRLLAFVIFLLAIVGKNIIPARRVR
jgi:hypothetical protein